MARSNLKLGWIHSAGKNLIPMGNAVAFRLHPEQYQPGRWLDKWIGDTASKRAQIYIDHRSYRQQLTESISQRPSELMIFMDRDGGNITNVQAMTAEAVNFIFSLGFSGTLRVAGKNEFNETMSTGQYIEYMKAVRAGVNNTSFANRCRVSAGGISSDRSSIYPQLYSALSGIVDGFDYHTPGNGDLGVWNWIKGNHPSGKDMVNSEHYLYDLAAAHSYDDPTVQQIYRSWLTAFDNTGSLSAIYVLYPSIWSGSSLYNKQGLRLMDQNLNITKTFACWNVLEEWWKGTITQGNIGGTFIFSKPKFIAQPDWDIVINICQPQGFNPYIIAAIGWHETHWGTLGAGLIGWILGYGYFPGSTVKEKYKGLKNQVEAAVAMIQRSGEDMNSLVSWTRFATNYWKPSAPSAWAKSCWNIFTNLMKDVTTSASAAAISGFGDVTGKVVGSTLVLTFAGKFLMEIADLLDSISDKLDDFK